MAVSVPDDAHALQTPPDAAEATLLVRGFRSAACESAGPTQIQRLLFDAVTRSMTGFDVDIDSVALISPEEFAEALARRNLAFRSRIVQIMVLGELVLSPLPETVASRVAAFAAELGVSEDLVRTAEEFAAGSLALASVDFERNGYLQTAANASALHSSQVLQEAWAAVPDDAALAARWEALADLPTGTLGRRVHEFYLSRGFVVPGRPGSAPPLLAQHDWVHVLADYGTTVENEIEVFAFIARANDDPQAFSLLAMVVSLFETGYLARGAGLFEADRGHLARAGMTGRLADALRRGALTPGSTDFLGLDWFVLADRPLSVVREELAIPAKSPEALRVGSVGPWQPGGISPFQLAAGRKMAEAEGRTYDSFGAAV